MTRAAGLKICPQCSITGTGTDVPRTKLTPVKRKYWTLAYDWMLVTWPEYWPMIGQCKLQVTWRQHWLPIGPFQVTQCWWWSGVGTLLTLVLCQGKYCPLIGQWRSRDINTVLWLGQCWAADPGWPRLDLHHPLPPGPGIHQVINTGLWLVNTEVKWPEYWPLIGQRDNSCCSLSGAWL